MIDDTKPPFWREAKAAAEKDEWAGEVQAWLVTFLALACVLSSLFY